jgi:ParB family chromosome partitioning protein
MRGNQIPFWPHGAADPSVQSVPHVAHNGGEQEWYTPPAIIAVARQVLGTIDLDPASTPSANAWIQATRFFTVAENGLHQRWQGKVWLNPPYTAGVVDQFLRKLGYHLDTGDVPEALVLVNNATETQWFVTLASRASAVCFLVGRVHYLSPRGERSSPLQGQALLYCGPHPECFSWHCRSLGHVWLALPGGRPCRQPSLMLKETPP